MPKPLVRRSGDIPREDAPEELIKGLLSATGLLHLYGDTGCGKTHFALQCAWSWTSGASAFGMEPARPLRCAYVQADMGKGHYSRLKFQALDAGISVPADLTVIEFPPGAQKDVFAADVRATIAEVRAAHNIDLFIVDVADKMHSENPNDGQGVQRVLAQWEGLLSGRALWYLRHPRKKARGADPTASDLDESSGHLNWSNSCDAVLRLTRNNLLFEKIRIGPSLRPRALVADVLGGFFRLRDEVLEARVLAVLNADPFLPYRCVASQLNAPPTTVQRVIQRLRASGDVPILGSQTPANRAFPQRNTKRKPADPKS